MNRRWLPPLLIILGSLLLVTTILEVWLRFQGIGSANTYFLAGVAMSIPFIGVLIGGGYCVRRKNISQEYYPLITLGTVAGCVFFVVFFGVIGITLFETWLNRVGLFRWAVTVGAGNGLLISALYAQGITQEVALEREAVQTEEAEREQQLLEYLNALLRHEVLNTATAITAHADLAEEKTKSDYVEERLAIIQRQTDDLTTVIDDVQILLKTTEETTEFERRNLTTLIDAELRKLQDKHPDVEVERRCSEDLYVNGDELLKRLFSNVFENAVEHNESETPKIIVQQRRSQEGIAIAISDNGVGFQSDPFEKLSNPLEEMDTNHGLGLAIVDRLARRYGGDVALTETSPTGSTITVSLPAY